MNKRKNSLSICSELGGYDSDESSATNSGDGSVKKQNHSAIEKKRREKMNTYIQELSAMIPTCSAMKTKLDKLTILRMAVQHMKTIRGCPGSHKEANYMPSFLSEDELKSLILEIAEGFLLVVSCDRGRMLYVSESVINILNVSRKYLIGQSLFDILHPKDMSKVKEQLSSSDLIPKERFIDTKTGLPVKSDVVKSVPRLSSGSRRLFFCRLRQCDKDSMVKPEEQNKQPNIKKKLKYIPDHKKYVTIRCTGYLKSWPSSQIGVEQDNEREGDTDGCTLSCLIAVAKPTKDVHQLVQKSNSDSQSLFQFVTRQAMDGKFTFIDQNTTSILGYVPQELLGTSCYEYIHVSDIKHVAEKHYTVLLKNEKLETKVYRFRAKNGSFLRLKSELFCFRNPWTKDVEYIVSTNTVVLSAEAGAKGAGENGGAVENILVEIGVPSVLQDVPGVPCNLHPAASQIGWKIAEEVLEKQWNASSENNQSGDPKEGERGSPESMSVTTPPAEAIPSSPHQIGGATQSVQGAPSSGVTDARIAGTSAAGTPTTVPIKKQTSEDHDEESAMALIMNLVEADAGLGGAVDFTGLPWPLLNG